MDLWLRSQNREVMIKVDGLYVDIPNDFNSGGFGVYTSSKLTNNGFLRLGKYKTKERALEVLDEINDLLEQEEIFHIRKSSLNNLDDLADPKYILNPIGQPRVYTMPIE